MLATSVNSATFGNVGLEPYELEEIRQAEAIRGLRAIAPQPIKGARTLRVRMTMRGTKVATSQVIGRHRAEKIGFDEK